MVSAKSGVKESGVARSWIEAALATGGTFEFDITNLQQNFLDQDRVCNMETGSKSVKRVTNFRNILEIEILLTS